MFEDEQKAIDGLFDLTQEYAKKHNLSYILGCGRMANNQFFVGDIHHQANPNDIFYICQALIQDASLAKPISAAIIKYEEQFLKTYNGVEKTMKGQ